MIFIAPAIGIICAVVGAIVAMVAIRKNSRRIATTSELAERVFNPQRFDYIARRLEADNARLADLIVQANAAVDEIKRSSEELKLPQAMLAVRAALTSVRFLFSGR